MCSLLSFTLVLGSRQCFGKALVLRKISFARSYPSTSASQSGLTDAIAFRSQYSGL